jgi:hypothetical protein
MSADTLNAHTDPAQQSAKVYELSTGQPKEDGLTKSGPQLADFISYLPDHTYIYRPTGEHWPAASVNARVLQAGRIKTTDILDSTFSVESMTWHPGLPELIMHKVVRDGSGWVDKPGANTYNQYRPPEIKAGNSNAAQRWRDHLHCLYRNEADHIERWFAHRLQHPGEKINHVLVLGGYQGVGKDTLLAPIRDGVGPWNFAEISPTMMIEPFNPWVRNVVVRVSEARDLGDTNRYALYEHCKTLAVTPPETLPCNEKFIKRHYVFNCLGMIVTTNHLTGGLYLPSDDRRHFVAWSEIRREEFPEQYWRDFWAWYKSGGIWDTVAYLRGLDLTGFDPKAPPPQTEAWWEIVHASQAPEDTELGDLIAGLGSPPVLTLEQLAEAARTRKQFDLVEDLTDRKRRRLLPSKLERCGYGAVRNPDADDGLWKLNGSRRSFYGRRELSTRELISEVRKACSGTRHAE